MKTPKVLSSFFTPRNPLYAKNETEANRAMCLISGFSGVAVIIALILYICHIFPLHNYVPVYIYLPIAAALLFSNLYWRRTKMVERAGFKYYILFTILAMIGSTNVLLPKHGIIGYALIIVLANHYYNPRLGKIIFGSTLVTMLLCLYAGMFVGEYDPNLLTAGRVLYDEAQGAWVVVEPESPQDRFAFLHELLLQGTNRYLAVLGYYYFARALFLTLLFFASNALNVRTKRLLESESSAVKEKSRIDTELSVAEELQRSALPAPVFENKRISLLAQLRPAKEVGGDLYDYHWLDETHLGVLIGDVSGKGVPAAMFMMKAITSFRACYGVDVSPKQTMEKVNRLLYEGNESNMFVTCFYGILDVETGDFCFANAGHNPPMVHRKDGKWIPLNCARGFVLGSTPDACVRDQSVRLKEGDALILYTDGITEAKNAKGEFFGEERFLKFLNYREREAVSIVEFGHELEDSVDEFTQDAEQSDDITYLVVAYACEAVLAQEVTFAADLSQGEALREYMTNCAKAINVKGAVLNNFLVCIDEIFSNIVKYGNVPADQGIHFRCVYRPEPRIATITIVDKGIPFDPRTVKEKRVDERESGAPVGGLGWLMVQRLMDEIAYHRINGKNVVSISKKL